MSRPRWTVAVSKRGVAGPRRCKSQKPARATRRIAPADDEDAPSDPRLCLNGHLSPPQTTKDRNAASHVNLAEDFVRVFRIVRMRRFRRVRPSVSECTQLFVLDAAKPMAPKPP